MKSLNPMLPSLVLNLAIVVLIGFVLYVTLNPLALFGLLLLRDMPVIVPEDTEPDDACSMGFVN